MVKPIHEWVGGFEQFWGASFDTLTVLNRIAQRNRLTTHF
jgi:hypothetical protein